MFYSYKQVIVVRKDLNMRKGKISAQSAHSAMMFLSNAICPMFGNFLERIKFAFKILFKNDVFSEMEKEWLTGSFAKIVVYVESEKELEEIHKKALEKGLKVNLCIDAGCTEFHGIPTKTCLAIGPDESKKIDEVTAGLKLL